MSMVRSSSWAPNRSGWNNWGYTHLERHLDVMFLSDTMTVSRQDFDRNYLRIEVACRAEKGHREDFLITCSTIGLTSLGRTGAEAPYSPLLARNNCMPCIFVHDHV